MFAMKDGMNIKVESDLIEEVEESDVKLENVVDTGDGDISFEPEIDFSDYIVEEVVETEEFIEEEYIDAAEDEETEQGSQIQYACNICDRLFDKHYYLERHIQLHNAMDEYEEVQEVIEEDSNNEVIYCYECHVCSEKFDSYELLISHEKVHKKSQVYKCIVCTKIYRTRNSLYKHFQQVHTVSDRCIACDLTFTDIIEHVKFHHGEKCPVCEKHFFDVDELKEHVVTIHVAKTMEEVTDEALEIKCNVCSKHFKNMIHLQAHIRRTHSKEKVLECPLCGKQFKSANSFTCYTSHINIHTGEKPYKCQYCPKTFGNSGTLHKHKKIHTGENFHRCSLCDKKFRDASYLTRHLKSCAYRYNG